MRLVKLAGKRSCSVVSIRRLRSINLSIIKLGPILTKVNPKCASRDSCVKVGEVLEELL